MSFDDFFNSSEYGKYQQYQNSRTVEQAFNFIQSPEAIDKMIIASQHGRPALEGIVEEIERLAGPHFDISGDKFLRQAVGSFIKFTLVPFGYAVEKQKTLNKGNIFTSASSYIVDGNKQTKRLVRELKIENI